MTGRVKSILSRRQLMSAGAGLLATPMLAAPAIAQSFNRRPTEVHGFRTLADIAIAES